jgi:hypothetical protein
VGRRRKAQFQWPRNGICPILVKRRRRRRKKKKKKHGTYFT